MAISKIGTSSIDGLGYGFKNRIINGAMMIDQRNAGASVTANNVFTLDRWGQNNDQASKYTIQQNAGSVTPPIGFTNYLGVTSTSSYAVGTNEAFVIYQAIEGYNIADLGWGTADAKTVTLSFWVRSSLTGTFGGSLQSISRVRNYPFSYTISAANTWEQKIITIAGDITGTWNTTNSQGIYLNFSLGSGSARSGTAGSWSGGTTYFSATGATSVVGTSGATFYITGVQLEKGSTATSFDYRPYGTELSLCQRYYVKGFVAPGYIFGVQNGGNEGAQRMSISEALPVEMRATPTVTYTFTNYDVAVDGGLTTITTRSLRFRGYSSFSGGYWNGAWSYQATAEI
jgi:hypothetical protein